MRLLAAACLCLGVPACSDERSVVELARIDAHGRPAKIAAPGSARAGE